MWVRILNVPSLDFMNLSTSLAAISTKIESAAHPKQTFTQVGVESSPPY